MHWTSGIHLIDGLHIKFGSSFDSVGRNSFTFQAAWLQPVHRNRSIQMGDHFREVDYGSAGSGYPKVCSNILATGLKTKQGRIMSLWLSSRGFGCLTKRIRQNSSKADNISGTQD